MRHWLLELRLQGRSWRLTSSPEGLSLSSSSGEVFTYEPGLEDPAPALSTSSVEGLEIPLSVLLPVLAWEQLAGAANLSGFTGELALWEEGDSWEERQVWVDGRVDQPVYATAGEPVTFSLVEVPWEDRSLFPKSTELISGSTWPTQAGRSLPEAAIGLYYPYVFGAPGVIYASDTGLTEFFGWPVLLVEIDTTTRDNFTGAAVSATVLLAAHPMAATSIKLYNRTTGLSATVTVTQLADLIGQTPSVASVTGATLQITEGDELWASCTSTAAGGLKAPEGGVARGLGQVAEWLLRQSTFRVDLTRLTQLQKLNAFNVDFYINQPASAWSILTDMILAGDLFPAWWRRSEHGYYLAVKPFELSALTVEPELQVDPARFGGDRTGPITISSSAELYTDFLIRFGRDEGVGQFRRQLVMGPNPSSGLLENPYCQAALAGLQTRKTLELDAPAVQDPGTAWLLLLLLARDAAQTRKTLAYLLPPNPLLEIGKQVRVTDAEVRISGLRGWITDLVQTAEGGWIQVGIEELPDLLRTAQGGN